MSITTANPAVAEISLFPCLLEFLHMGWLKNAPANPEKENHTKKIQGLLLCEFCCVLFRFLIGI